jgi:hypothetical protein
MAEPTQGKTAPSPSRASWVLPLCLMIVTASALVVGYLLVVKTGSGPVEVDGPPHIAELDGAPGLLWATDFQAALARGHRDKKLIILAFEALSDTNGGLNHHKFFSRPAVQAELRRYVRVVLYVDIVPRKFYATPPGEEQREKDAEANRKYQTQRFYTAQTPWYAVLRPTPDGDFEIVGTYNKGLIQDEEQFIAFLRAPAKLGK